MGRATDGNGLCPFYARAIPGRCNTVVTAALVPSGGVVSGSRVAAVAVAPARAGPVEEARLNAVNVLVERIARQRPAVAAVDVEALAELEAGAEFGVDDG